MKFSPLIISLIVGCAAGNAAGLTFSGGDAITVIPDKSTGLDAIYVLKNVAGVKAYYTADDSGAKVEWNTFSQSGVSTTPLPWNIDGASTSVNLPSGDVGLIVTEGTRPHYYWIVNYADHRMELNSVDFSDESDCSNLVLAINGSASPITYYTVNRVPKELSRDIMMAFNTLEYDADAESYKQVAVERTLEHLASTLSLQSPLCDTRFIISGDRFLSQWKESVTAETGFYNARAVEAHTSAEMLTRENDNEIRVDGGALGGSAPVEVSFKASVTDAVQFTEWQFSRDSEFNTIDLRYTEQQLTYEFEEFGDHYVRFVSANSDGSCEWTSEIYTVSVSESKLLCPNAFSPNGDGVNDIWKVSYKSIVDFECTIVNRWGNKIIEFTDPAEGWDGKYNGKLVPSGVYYYVIKATGSDGIKYNLAGDINIINYRQGTGGSAEPVE